MEYRDYLMRQVEQLDYVLGKILSNLFTAENVDSDKRDQLYKKSLAIYQYIEELDNAYSFDRNFKMAAIQERLKGI